MILTNFGQYLENLKLNALKIFLMTKIHTSKKKSQKNLKFQWSINSSKVKIF